MHDLLDTYSGMKTVSVNRGTLQRTNILNKLDHSSVSVTLVCNISKCPEKSSQRTPLIVYMEAYLPYTKETCWMQMDAHIVLYMPKCIHFIFCALLKLHNIANMCKNVQFLLLFDTFLDKL